VWNLSGVVPENLSPAQAASISTPFGTALRVPSAIGFLLIVIGIQVQSLYYHLKLPQHPSKSDKGEWISILGGASVLDIFEVS
jgi:NADPH:quinone reductase-like Zn-dependent oxidoreductase